MFLIRFTSIFFVFLFQISQVQAEYEGPICGYDKITYETAHAARKADIKILHCGPCGHCSNKHDIDIYNSTKDTLTKMTTKCAWAAVFLGRKASERCMNRNVGFSKLCNKCWIDNIMCDMEHCKKTCILWKMFRIGKSKSQLDPCLECDEVNCGGAFKKCAGANRRRVGIVTDIDRPGTEICTINDIDL